MGIDTELIQAREDNKRQNIEVIQQTHKSHLKDLQADYQYKLKDLNQTLAQRLDMEQYLCKAYAEGVRARLVGIYDNPYQSPRGKSEWRRGWRNAEKGE